MKVNRPRTKFQVAALQGNPLETGIPIAIYLIAILHFTYISDCDIVNYMILKKKIYLILIDFRKLNLG